MPKLCEFVECDESIRSNHHLCRPHWEEEQEDEIDKCGGCGQYKLSQYEFCLDCKRAQSRSKKKASVTKSKSKVAESKPEYVLDAPDPRPRKDDDTNVFYVYLLYLDGQDYYVGHTNDLITRLFEHRTGQTKSTKGRNPELAWYSRVRTRGDARDYEKYLQEQCNSNRRAINRMITDFLKLNSEVRTPS